MLTQKESELWGRGIKYIAGIDEVGRGCLAGPMVIGAVIINSEHILNARNNDVSNQKILELYEQINDSKKVTPKRRGILSDFIKKHAISYSIEIISNQKIDEWGISKCTQVGFFNAINKLTTRPEHILTDTFQIKLLPKNNQTNIIKGDTISISIAAASIIAKVYRDLLMVDIHNHNDEYKKYAFDQHKGYGTKKHLEAIQKHGVCDLHRLSFSPCTLYK